MEEASAACLMVGRPWLAGGPAAALVRQLEHLTGKRVILQPPPEQPAA
jgi:hypothetical protein